MRFMTSCRLSLTVRVGSSGPLLETLDQAGCVASRQLIDAASSYAPGEIVELVVTETSLPAKCLDEIPLPGSCRLVDGHKLTLTTTSPGTARRSNR